MRRSSATSSAETKPFFKNLPAIAAIVCLLAEEPVADLLLRLPFGREPQNIQYEQFVDCQPMRFRAAGIDCILPVPQAAVSVYKCVDLLSGFHNFRTLIV